MPTGAPDGSILIETKIGIEEAEKAFKKSVGNIRKTGKQIDKAFQGTEKNAEKTEKALVGAADTAEDFGSTTKKAGNNAKKSLNDAGKAAEGTAEGFKDISDASDEIDGGNLAEMVRELDNVNAQIEVQQRLLDGLREKYESVAQETGTDSPQALKLQSQILKAESAVEKMIGTSDRMAEKIREVDDSMGNAGATSVRFRDLVKGVFSVFGKNADDAVDAIGDAFDKYEGKLNSAKSLTRAASDLMGGLIKGGIASGVLAAVEWIAKLGAAVAKEAAEIERQTDRIQAALNLSEEAAAEAEETVRNVYNKGLLEMQDAEQAVVSVMKRLEITGEEAEAVTNAASAVAIAHGEDLQQVIRTASILMNTYGMTAMQSVDLIAYAFDKSAGKFDDLLDAMGEYAPRAKEIGYSAADMVAAISSAADAGALSADKSLDIIKEAYNKAAGATDEYKEALHELGVNSDTTIARLTGGGERARAEMTRIVEKLAQVRDGAERSRLASILLGSQWEDTSIDIAAAVTSAAGAVTDFTGAAEKDFQTLVSNNATAVEQIKRKWSDFPREVSKIAGKITSILGPVNDLMLKMRDNLRSGVRELLNPGGTSLSGYSAGTSSASSGLHRVAENGAELIDTGEGLLLASAPTVYAFSGGESVYTAAQTSRALQRMQAAVDTQSARRAIRAAPGGYSVGSTTGLAPVRIDETNYNFGEGSVVIDPKGIKDLEGFAQVLERERNRRQDTQMGVSARRIR